MLPVSGRALGLARQLLVVFLIHVPTVSLGLAMGWVSLVSGEHGRGGGAEAGVEAEDGRRVVAAAATTFLASLVGVPLSAAALRLGRKFATIATSLCFVVCWSLKLAGGGWRLAAARAAAGLGGAGAYSIPPLVAREMCSGRVRGAASSALVLAHNAGLLLMYVCADLGLPHRTVVWWCLGASLAHCVAFLLVPESPAFLAANKRDKEAARALAWLRGARAGDAALALELRALPPPDDSKGLVAVLRELVSVPARRRAFVISFIAVVGQEACGVYTLLQFAERAFVLARDAGHAPAPLATLHNATLHGATLHNATLHDVGVAPPMLTPARQAVILGVVQLITSAVALYLVEKVGRRPLLLWSGAATGGCLALGAALAWVGVGVGAAAALGGAVAADSGGLQPAPYALLADMFRYEHRSSALMVASAAACVAGAAEVLVFPALAAARGLAPALALAAALTAAYTLYVFCCVPETRGLTPDQVYELLAKPQDTEHSVKDAEPSSRV